jgi:hypothetical protein
MYDIYESSSFRMIRKSILRNHAMIVIILFFTTMYTMIDMDCMVIVQAFTLPSIRTTTMMTRISKRPTTMIHFARHTHPIMKFQNAITTFVTIADRHWMLYASTFADEDITTMDTNDNNNATKTIRTATTANEMSETTMTTETPNHYMPDGIIELATKHDNYFIDEINSKQEENQSSLAITEKDNNMNNHVKENVMSSGNDIASIPNRPVEIETDLTTPAETMISPIPAEDLERVLIEMEREANNVVNELMDENCEVDPETGKPADDLCTDDVKRIGFRNTLKQYVNQCIQMVRGTTVKDVDVFTMDLSDDDDDEIPQGELLERGCKSYILG